MPSDNRVETPLRLGVAGLGAVAQSVHLPLIHRRWDLFKLTAVADFSATMTAHVGESYGVGTDHRYSTLEAMLDGEELDGVVLLTSGSHGAAAAECVRRGVPVFCEKPLAFSLADVDALIELEDASSRPLLLLGYMKEYDAAVRRMRERLADVTDIRYVDVEVLHPSGESQLDFANLHAPVTDLDKDLLSAAIEQSNQTVSRALGDDASADLRDSYENIVLGSLIHDIALVRSLVGPVESVQHASQWARGPEPGSLEVLGATADATRVHMHWHFMSDYPRYRETVTVHHSTGSLSVEFTVPYLVNAPTVLTIVSRDGDGESVEVVRDVEEAFETELAAFHDMVVDQTPPLAASREGRTDVVTGQRIMRALAADRGIRLGGEVARLS